MTAPARKPSPDEAGAQPRRAAAQTRSAKSRSTTEAPASTQPRRARTSRSTGERSLRERSGSEGRRQARAGAEAPARAGERRPRTAAAERAYAKRAQREGRPAHNSNHRVAQAAASAADQEAPAGRASFVVLVISLLVVGVAATLWLTTQAIADTYRLDAAKNGVTELAERAAQLQREVSREESAPALARRAEALGMVPSGDPGHIRVAPDGSTTVIGEPTPAAAPPPVRTPQEIAAEREAARVAAEQERQRQEQQQQEQQQQQQQEQQEQPPAPPAAGGG
ncbi:hypothetical protein [Actinokineospora pegani]|uniref:hypothetical protein n=1 Tax=Actinokineospora pegani TaxID=2654637 RepID=UPI0012E9F14E|nr:hypothetical protein [Actinokineospora pegani]